MTKIEKQMLAGMAICVVFMVISIYVLLKALEPVTKNIDQHGIKPYVMQLWEGKK